MTDTSQAGIFFGPPNWSNGYQNVTNTNNYYPGQSITVGASTSGIQAVPGPAPLEWAEFAMWVRGFLFALEGKELTPEDSAKIMEKLAQVDPESHQNRVYRPGTPLPYPPAPPIPQIPHIPQTWPMIRNNPMWQTTETVTTTGDPVELQPVTLVGQSTLKISNEPRKTFWRRVLS